MKDSRLDPGEIVGERYHIEGVLAAGGFATIHAALDMETSEPVVIKAMRRTARQHDAVAYERFEREARIAATLVHPHNVRTLGHGRLPDGHLYLVLERLHGGSLKKHITAQGARDPETTARYLTQVLGALDESHGLGVIHRDLKPANLFLCDAAPGDALPFIKVLDYGFARRLGRDATPPPSGEVSRSVSLTRLTEEGMLVGTPGYLAPEVCLGEDADERADLYALGLIGHELLTGAPVYAGAPIERARKQLHEDPPSLPPPLDAHPLAVVIERLTFRDPGRRYPDAAAVLADLERVARGEALRRKRWWRFWR